MTDAVIFTNNASSRLGIPVAAASITITVETGTGARFPSPGADEFFPVMVNDRRTGQFEIMYCTQRINDILTVDRAQEGTAAQNWLLGASVWSTATAGTFATYFNYSYSKDQADARFVNVVGDTMTGALTLPGDPTIAKHATTMEWVQAQIAFVTSIGEAPNDGAIYGRKNIGWTPTITLAAYNADAVALDSRFDVDELNISTLQTQMALRITDAPVDGSEYVRKNGGWSILGAALTDAPSDGSLYGRLNAVWTKALALAGGILTGNLTIAPAAGNALLILNKASGAGGDVTQLSGRTANLPRWTLNLGDSTVEGGANSGSDFSVRRCTDAGAVIDTALFINRASGIVDLPLGATTATPAPGDNDTSVATTAFVAALAALKAPLASPALTGNPTAPTAAPGDNDTSIATTAFVAAADALKADLASPALTGNPTAPTPAAGDNDTSIATTAFVRTEIANKTIRTDTVQGLAAAPRATARANTGLVIPPQARLSLSSNDAISAADLTAQTTVRLWPFQGELVPVWNATDTEFKTPVLAIIGLSLDSNAAHTNYQQADRNFDIFAFLNAGVLTIGNGPSWNAGAVAGSDVARGTGAGSTELENWHGLRVNKNAIALRIDTTAGTVAVAAREATYIGTMRATADGVTEDSQAKRFISNGYAVNRVRRHMLVIEPANTWTYATAAFRQANANTANQLDYVQGVDGDSVEATVGIFATATVANTLQVLGIGLDSTTTAAPGCIMNADYWVGTADPVNPRAEWRGNPGLGRHRLVWLEYAQASGIVTWYGDNNTPTFLQSGIVGSMMG